MYQFFLEHTGFNYVLCKTLCFDAVEGMFLHVTLKRVFHNGTDAKSAKYVLRQIPFF